METLTREFRGSCFGDRRLSDRVLLIADALSSHPVRSINSAAGSFEGSKAAYRFLNNPKVNSEKLSAVHFRNTAGRIAEDKGEVIIVQDTTELNYPSVDCIEDLGNRLHSPGYAKPLKGIMVHTSLSVSRSGVPLGVLKQTYFTFDEIRARRSQEVGNQAGINQRFPIDEKASHRWLDHARAVQKQLAGCDTKCIFVTDREGDIFELIQEINESQNFFVIRSHPNRRTQVGEKFHDTENLETELSRAKPLGKISVEIKGKTRKCQVKAVCVNLKPPQRHPNAQAQQLRPQRVFVVDVTEMPFQDQNPATRIQWRLLTNRPCLNFKGAIDIVQIYKVRWCIECFHRILKSGFSIEKCRLRSRVKIEKLTALLSVISWHLYWLYTLSRALPNMQAASIFPEDVLKVLRLSAPKMKIELSKKKITLKQAVLIIARIGGFLNRTSDGNPGMQSMWRGWAGLQERLQIFEFSTCG